MVLRPKNLEPDPEIPDVEFVEELVRKSLAVNQHLRSGESTTKYLKKLRQEAAAAAKGPVGDTSGHAAEAAAPKPRSQLDRKKSTLGTFIESKAVDFDGQLAKLTEKRRQLEQEERQLREKFIDGLVDMLVLVSEGEDLSAFRSVLGQHQAFVSQLGVRDVDLLKAAKKR